MAEIFVSPCCLLFSIHDELHAIQMVQLSRQLLKGSCQSNTQIQVIIRVNSPHVFVYFVWFANIWSISGNKNIRHVYNLRYLFTKKIWRSWIYFYFVQSVFKYCVRLILTMTGDVKSAFSYFFQKVHNFFACTTTSRPILCTLKIYKRLKSGNWFFSCTGMLPWTNEEKHEQLANN